MPHALPLPPLESGQVAVEAAELVDMLEVLWGRGREAAPLPVPPSQLRALTVIDAREGVNLRDLAAALGSTPPSVSRLCDRLEAAGLVRRSRATANRREVELRLSASGRGVLASVRSARAKELEGVLTAMPATELRKLFEGMASFRTAASGRAGRDGRRDAAPVCDFA